MSVSALTKPGQKPWLNAELNNLTVDNALTLPNGAVNKSVLTSNALGVASWKPIPASSTVVVGAYNQNVYLPTGTSSVSTVMTGLGASPSFYAYTPQTSGNIKVSMGGILKLVGSTGTLISTSIMAYGTGTAPINGAVPVGTFFGNGANTAGLTGTAPFFCVGYVTGLTVGTTYWFDLTQATGNAADTASVSPSMFMVEEYGL